MRFSLRTLLLMFPVIVLLAYGLACAFAFVQVVPERPGSTVDRIELYNNAINFNVSQAKAGKQTDIHTLELWLQGNLPWTHPDFQLYAGNLTAQTDHWGRAIQCVPLNPTGKPLPAVRMTNNVGLYSLGRDGESLSHGMDDDDVNSWITTSEQTQAMGMAWVYERMHEQAGYYMPWTLGLILILGFFVMWLKIKWKRVSIDAV